MRENKWKHIPNILTILRLLFIPMVAYFMITERWVEGLVLFVVAELTDIVDGYIARRFHCITNFGKLADPLADKLIQLTAVFLLAWKGRIQFIFFIILAGKELAMIIGALFFLRKDVVVSSNWIGKAAASILFAGIVLAFLNIFIANYILWAGVVVSVTAAVVYLRGYLNMLN